MGLRPKGEKRSPKGKLSKDLRILLISFEGKIEFSVLVSFSSVCCLSRYIVLCWYGLWPLCLGALRSISPSKAYLGPK